MSGWLSELRASFLRGLSGFFRRSSCEKLIVYNGSDVAFGALGGEIGPAKFSLGQYSREVHRVHRASELAKSLDDYQYLMCNMSSELERGSARWTKLFERRAAAVMLITATRIALEAVRSDPDVGRSKLEKLLSELENFTTAVADETMGRRLGPSNLADKAVSRAFVVTGIEPADLRQVFDEVSHR